MGGRASKADDADFDPPRPFLPYIGQSNVSHEQCHVSLVKREQLAKVWPSLESAHTRGGALVTNVTKVETRRPHLRVWRSDLPYHSCLLSQPLSACLMPAPQIPKLAFCCRHRPAAVTTATLPSATNLPRAQGPTLSSRGRPSGLSCNQPRLAAPARRCAHPLM